MDPMGSCIHRTIFLNFFEELGSGKLTFQSLELDNEDNIAIAEKYSATPFSMFISEARGNHERIIAVPEIWSTPRDAIEELVKSKI